MKVTVKEPYTFHYGGKRYGAGKTLDAPLSVITTQPWVFEETQDEVTAEQRKFLDSQSKLQKQMGEKLAAVREEVEGGKK